jgi:hypothetical protein
MTRKQFIDALAKYPGVTLDTLSEGDGNIQIDTPKGKVFKAKGCHTIVEPFTNFHGHSWKPQAHAAVIESLRHGLEDCEEIDCDICEEK